MNIKEESFNYLTRVLPKWKHFLSDEVYKHSDRVCDISLRLTEDLNLNLHERVMVGAGCMIHDIGKSVVNPDVLNKKEHFTPDDKIITQRHAFEGFKLIKTLPFDKIVFDIVHYHHETLDGTGYPDLLTARKIPLAVQIVSVADIFEAITADRVYAKAQSPQKAIEILRTQFKDKVNQTIVSLLEEHVEQGLF